MVLVNTLEHFGFVKTTAVAVGAFNTQIIHPEWLQEVEILPKGSETEVQINFQQPGIRLVPEGNRGVWTIRPDKLIIESTERDYNPGLLISQILRLLPWTPVSAVGLNYIFEGERLSDEIVGKLCFPGGGSVTDYNIEQRSWHITLKPLNSKAVRNVQLSVTDKLSRIAVNFHRDASPATKEATWDFFGDHASNLEEAARLSRNLFGFNLK